MVQKSGDVMESAVLNALIYLGEVDRAVALGYNAVMKTFKSDYLKYNKSGYFDSIGISELKLSDILQKHSIRMTDIETIISKTQYRVEGAVVGEKFIIGRDKNRVDIPTKLIKSEIVVHSHPDGTSFSADDIFETITFGGKGVVAFNDEFFYVFTNNTAGDVELLSLFSEIASLVEESLIKKVNNGTITKSQMYFAINHKVWLKIAQKIEGFGYEAYKIKK